MNDTAQPPHLFTVCDVEFPDCSSYTILLWRKAGAAPVIDFSAESAEPDEIGASLQMTAAEAREMAARLIEAAEAIEDGWI
jgi:hypothetical protein